jgi:hypothetical protein
MTPSESKDTTAPLGASEQPPQDDDALLATVKQVIVRSTRKSASRFAPLISAVSIALRQPQDDDSTADGQDVEVAIYTPLNAGTTSAYYRRLERYVHNLLPGEMAEFVRLVDQICGETANGDDDEEEDDDEGEDKRGKSAKMKRLQQQIGDRDQVIHAYQVQVDELEKGLEQKNAGSGDDKHKASELRRARNLLAQRDLDLADAQARIAELEREVEARDAESEDEEEKAAQMKKLQELLEESTDDLKTQKALNVDLNGELTGYRRRDAAASSAPRGNAGNNDKVVAATGARDADDSEDDALTFDHADGPEPSVDGARLPKKPTSRAPSTMPPPSMTPFGQLSKQNAQEDNPQHQSARQGSKADEQSETTKRPTETDQPDKTKNRKSRSGMYLNGYDLEYGPPKSINGSDPEATRRQIRRESKDLLKKGKSNPETPENATTGTFAADEGTETPSGKATKSGSGRKQSIVSTKGRKSTDDNVDEADDEYTSDVEEPPKPTSKKKRKADESDEEEEPVTSKKPRFGRKLQSVEEESDNEDKPVHAAKRPDVSSGSKAKVKVSNAKQSAKRKVAQDDSAEFEGGMLNPMFISSAEETDSDMEDDY